MFLWCLCVWGGGGGGYGYEGGTLAVGGVGMGG